MWIVPLVLVGAILVAAASSPRGGQPPQRQLAAPGRAPGPIAVLGEILRIGGVPPPMVVLCAVAEAQSIGRRDLAADILQVFGAPGAPRGALRPRTRRPPSYERGSCALTRSPRAEADCSREDGPITQGRPRASCDVPEAPQSPSQGPVAARQVTEEEMLALLHTDPKAFVERATSGRPAAFAASAPLPTSPSPSSSLSSEPQQAPPAHAAEVPGEAATLAEQLLQVPGFAGAGIVLVDPSTGSEVFEVQWLLGHQIPPLPPAVEGRPLRLAVVASLPVPQPTGMPAEDVVQTQETGGLREAADRTRAMAPGSPLGAVTDEAWRELVARLEREAPTFSSSRHVGQYRQRRERLAELGIDPSTILGSAAAQRGALDTDLADAHRHAAAGGVLSRHLGRAIVVPGYEGLEVITLSGVLGVIQCAGLDGAVSWLEKASDRKRYPHTTEMFVRTNGVF